MPLPARTCVWALDGIPSDAQFETLLRQRETALSPFAGADETVAFATLVQVLTRRKPA